MVNELTNPDGYEEGESFTRKPTIHEGGSPKDISGASVKWYLLETRGEDVSEAVIDHNTDGVSASVTNASDGKVEVSIERGVTDGYGPADMWEVLVVEDQTTGRQVWNGEFTIESV